MNWEYKVIGLLNYETNQRNFEQLGAEGWELVSVTETMACFKRPIQKKLEKTRDSGGVAGWEV
jgi:hypothetical protein